MGKIDDPFDAAKSQYPEPVENRPGELALRIGGVVVPIIGIVNSVRDYFTQAAVNERLTVLVEAVNAKTNAISEKIETPQLAEAIRSAIEETWRTTDIDKVKGFGSIIGNAVATGNSESLKETAEYMRRERAGLSF